MANQRLNNMWLNTLPQQISDVEMPKRMTGLVTESETIQKQRILLCQDVGAVWSARLAQKQMGKLQRILELRTEISDIPAQDADVDDIDGDNTLGIVLGFLDPQRGRTQVEIVGCLRIKASRGDFANPAARGVGDDDESVVCLVGDRAP